MTESLFNFHVHVFLKLCMKLIEPKLSSGNKVGHSHTCSSNIHLDLMLTKCFNSGRIIFFICDLSRWGPVFRNCVVVTICSSNLFISSCWIYFSFSVSKGSNSVKKQEVVYMKLVSQLPFNCATGSGINRGNQPKASGDRENLNHKQGLIKTQISLLFITRLKYEPRYEISNNVVCAISKGSDQPAHMRSLIRAFACSLTILWLLSYWANVIWSR